LTSGYATAFVEVSEWKEPFVTVAAAPGQFFDLDIVASLKTNIWDHQPEIFPIPASNQINIRFREGGSYLLELWGYDGVLALWERLPIGASEYSLNVRSLPEGAYQLVLISDVNKFVQQVMIVR
ncbi:hypothetical protein RZS08_15725, partial [Arthrospira platensis SPKY1]|nr:hypothetical protein [Arthrospira platensis SPKY1]